MASKNRFTTVRALKGEGDKFHQGFGKLEKHLTLVGIQGDFLQVWFQKDCTAVVSKLLLQ